MNQLIVKTHHSKATFGPFFSSFLQGFFWPKNWGTTSTSSSESPSTQPRHWTWPSQVPLTKDGGWTLLMFGRVFLKLLSYSKNKKTIPKFQWFQILQRNGIFFWRKNILGGYLAWKAFVFFSICFTESFSLKVFFWKFGTGSSYWEDGRKISGDCTSRYGSWFRNRASGDHHLLFIPVNNGINLHINNGVTHITTLWMY